MRIKSHRNSTLVCQKPPLLSRLPPLFSLLFSPSSSHTSLTDRHFLITPAREGVQTFSDSDHPVEGGCADIFRSPRRGRVCRHFQITLPPFLSPRSPPRTFPPPPGVQAFSDHPGEGGCADMFEITLVPPLLATRPPLACRVPRSPSSAPSSSASSSLGLGTFPA